MEIDGFEIIGRAKCNRQRKGGVLLKFSRVKIRPSWHQQEFTRIFLFWSVTVFLVFHRDAPSDDSGLGTIVGVESPFPEYSFVLYGSSLLP